MSGKVKWHGKRVRLKLKNAEQAMLDAAAFAIEGPAKAGAPVDTGFLQNSIYVITPKSNTYGGARGAAMGSQRHPSQVMAPPAPVPSEGAIVAVGARYAVYAELRTAFLYPAVERVAGSSGARIVLAGRRAL